MKKYMMLVLLGFFALLMVSCSYDPPEGSKLSHHKYKEVLAYAKSIDPNATVSEEYSDTKLEWKEKVREWNAVINGIECHVASVGRMISDRTGEFFKPYYFVDTDYDNYWLLDFLQGKNYLLSNYKSIDNISYRYHRYNNMYLMPNIDDTTTQLSDDMLEQIWMEATTIYDEYNKGNHIKVIILVMNQPALVKSYDAVETQIKLDINQHGYYNDLSETGKETFFKEYKEAWSLVEEDK